MHLRRDALDFDRVEAQPPCGAFQKLVKSLLLLEVVVRRVVRSGGFALRLGRTPTPRLLHAWAALSPALGLTP